MLTLTSTLFDRLVRIAARSILIQHGPKTLSNLVHEMGLDPRNHKGTVHAVLVRLESAGTISATRNDKTGKRDLWFIHTDKIRTRDRIAAATLF